MLIDSHCHLPHSKYQLNIDQILQDCKSSSVEKLINISTSLKDCIQNKEISKKYKDIYYTVAIYPHNDLNKDISQSLQILEKDFLKNKDNKLVAIGECGIDIVENKNSHENRSIQDQIILFEEQIKLAIKYDLPLIIHNRNGDEIVIDLIKKYNNQGLKGVLHCFDSNWDFAKKLIDLNFYISFSGMVTFKSKHTLHEVAKNIPLDKFLVETDAPYLSPEPFRGQVNYPKNVTLVAKKIAEIKNMPLKQVADSSYQNTLKLFNL